MRKVVIDYETRSECDLKTHGVYEYSIHPSTQILCLGWSGGGQWKIGDKPPVKLFELIAHPDALVVGHNVMFERLIWLNVCAARMGWPSIDELKWRCTASKAAACSIPRGLAHAGAALKLNTVKDEEGKRSMMLMSKPKGGEFNEDPKHFKTMLAYNAQDVIAEEALDARLPNLSSKELQVWRLDQRMNVKGIRVDRAGCVNAVSIAMEYADRVNARAAQIVPGLTSVTQRAKVNAWLKHRGVYLPDTTAATLDAYVKEYTGEPGPALELIKLLRSAGRSSVAKYQAMVDKSNRQDWMVRDFLMYHGAHTGRWAGKGIQIHNYPKGDPKGNLKDMNHAWKMIHRGDLDLIEMTYGDPMKFLSGALRGSIIPPPGKKMYCADYAAIEARVTFWMADERAGLRLFRDRTQDIYLDMASVIYNRLVKDKKGIERFLGKQAILGLGFGMGYIKFLMHCRTFGVKFGLEQILSIVPARERSGLSRWIQGDDWKRVRQQMPEVKKSDVPELVLMKYVVDKYRKKYQAVVKAWSAIEAAAKSAVMNPGKVYIACKTKWQMWDIFLVATLPSGRKIYYPYPETDDQGLTYMGEDSQTHQWVRIRTWGGKLLENVVQGTARDFMVEGMFNIDFHSDYELGFTVHDEIASYAEEGDLDEYLEMVTRVPEWGEGCPVTAEGWVGMRYKKE